MPKKPKFRPRITMIKLNPEQAVLQCDCYKNFRLTFIGAGAGWVFVENAGGITCSGKTLYMPLPRPPAGDYQGFSSSASS